MLKGHHLNNSRSQRILWLMEELGLPYESVVHTPHTPGDPPVACPKDDDEIGQIHSARQTLGESL